MDKNGLIHEHSKIKLELYRLYLERYLSVLLVANFFNRIDVIDVFAGCGISENGEKGSSIIAAEAIDTISKNNNPHKKQVFLKLNDTNQQNYKALQQHLQSYGFASLSCNDANTFIQNWQPISNGHNLFFIDPHGYTQIDTANLKRLFGSSNCDFLIFIPIHHIYRFLKPTEAKKDSTNPNDGLLEGICEKAKKRKEVDPSTYYAPIAGFLAGLGIDQQAAKQANSAEDFANMIADALRTISGSEYVYFQMLENKEKNSKYSLFFISHHILGAEKFLEAQKGIKAKSGTPENQQIFDFVSQPESESILQFIEYDHIYDNVSLYEYGIKFGMTPVELKNQLKSIEKNDERKIEIKEIPGKKRNRGGLYIDYKHFKENDRIITVIFRR